MIVVVLLLHTLASMGNIIPLELFTIKHCLSLVYCNNNYYMYYHTHADNVIQLLNYWLFQSCWIHHTASDARTKHSRWSAWLLPGDYPEYQLGTKVESSLGEQDNCWRIWTTSLSILLWTEPQGMLCYDIGLYMYKTQWLLQFHLFIYF